MTKPPDREELLLRIKALLRRTCGVRRISPAKMKLPGLCMCMNRE